MFACVYMCVCACANPSVIIRMSIPSNPTTSLTPSSSVPDDLHRIANLQHFDIRLNKIKCGLPHSTAELRNLVRLNIQGNGFPEINTRRLPFLELLNCSENALRSLEIQEGPLTILMAKNNRTFVNCYLTASSLVMFRLGLCYNLS